MFARLATIIDPMVRLLIVALLLAILIPAQGTGRTIMQGVANAAIFLLFLMNGLRLPRAEVIAGLRDWRYHGSLAAWVFLGMLALGWGAWQAIGHLSGAALPGMVVLGFLYLGALPSTVQSSAAYTSLAGGNVANAVIGAAVLNVTGVFVSAPLFGLLAGGNSAVFSTQVLVKIALILLLPFLLGQALQGRFGGTVNRYPGVIRWMDRMAIALAIYVGMSGAVTGGVGELVSAAGWAWLLGAVLILLFVAGILSLIVARLLRLPRRSQISFQFAGMQKSIAMGAPLATILFDAESAGLILLPVLAYHFCQMVVAAPIAARWRNSEEAGGPINPA